MKLMMVTGVPGVPGDHAPDNVEEDDGRDKGNVTGRHATERKRRWSSATRALADVSETLDAWIKIVRTWNFPFYYL